MRIRIEIKTPAGYAASTAKQLEPFILGSRKQLVNEVYSNKTDDRIIWVIDGEVRKILEIQRNVALFDKTISMILTNKAVQKMAHLSTESKKQLEDMLKNHTKVKIIKNYEEMPKVNGYDWSKGI